MRAGTTGFDFNIRCRDVLLKRCTRKFFIIVIIGSIGLDRKYKNNDRAGSRVIKNCHNIVITKHITHDLFKSYNLLKR